MIDLPRVAPRTRVVWQICLKQHRRKPYKADDFSIEIKVGVVWTPEKRAMFWSAELKELSPDIKRTFETADWSELPQPYLCDKQAFKAYLGDLLARGDINPIFIGKHGCCTRARTHTHARDVSDCVLVSSPGSWTPLAADRRL